jgi:hypothetical protein
MGTLRVAELWEKEAWSGAGHRLGRIEAVAMGRDRVPSRVGVRLDGRGRGLAFYGLTGARLDGDRVILVLSVEPSLEVLSGGGSRGAG